MPVKAAPAIADNQRVELVLVVACVVLVGIALWYVRRARPESTVGNLEGFVLSGYRTQQSFEDRRPDWQSRPVTGRDNALARSSAWVRNAGEQAIVEVIRVDREVGRVAHLVTPQGTEPIDP